eukprot:4099924-Prymnesium_polylepis.2
MATETPKIDAAAATAEEAPHGNHASELPRQVVGQVYSWTELEALAAPHAAKVRTPRAIASNCSPSKGRMCGSPHDQQTL